MMFNSVDDLQDLLEFFHEVFEVDNKTVNKLLTNALLY